MTVRKGRRCYHIGLKKGDAGRYIILCGDPARAERVSRRFDPLILRRVNREFVTYTGMIDGVRITAMGTGIGPDNTEIVLVELKKVVPENSVVIRCGSSGGLQKHVNLGDIVVSTGAVRLEGTTGPYAEKGFPAVPDRKILSLMMGYRKRGVHFGVTATADGFYARQGRVVHPNIDDETLKVMMRLGVLNFEMETSALFILSRAFGFRSASACGVYANRVTDEFISPEDAGKTDERCIDIVIDTILRLALEGA